MIAALASLLEATPSHALTVALVRPAHPSELTVQTLVRLHGELTSLGFESKIFDAPVADGSSGPASRTWLEQLMARQRVDAVIALEGALAPDGVAVLVPDEAGKKTVVRTLSFQPPSRRAPDTLAIRAIELLRSSFLEMSLEDRDRRAQPVPPPPSALLHEYEPKPGTGSPQGFGIEAGGAGVMSLDGVGPALLPTVRIDWLLHSALVAHLALAGLGTRPTIRSGADSAQVEQEYGLLGASYRFLAGHRLRPLLALSAGALHTAVDGRAGSANLGNHVARWSFLLDAGLGLWLSLRDRLFLAATAHVQIAEPYPAIRFVEVVVATSARPNLLLTLTMGACL